MGRTVTQQVVLNPKDCPHIINKALESLVRTFAKEKLSKAERELINDLLGDAMEACTERIVVDRERPACFRVGDGTLTGAPIIKVNIKNDIQVDRIATTITGARKYIASMKLHLHERIVIGSLLDTVYRAVKRL